MYKKILFSLLFFTAGCAYGQEALLSRDSLLKDYDLLCSSLEKIHAGLFLYQPEERYRQKKEAIRALIRRDMSVEDFYLLIAPLVASAGDGHTFLSIPVAGLQRYVERGGLVCPLRLKLSDGKLLVDYSYRAGAEVSENEEILSINGVPSSAIVEKLYGLTGAEKGNALKNKVLTPHLSTLIWCMYGWEEGYRFEIRRAEGVQGLFMPGISNADALQALKAHMPARVEPYSFSIAEEEGRATLTVRTFFDRNGLVSFCDSVFPLLEKRKIRKLAIDVRGNGGGASAAVDALMSYIAHDAYRMYPRCELRVSEESKAYHRKLHPELYRCIQDRENGSFYRMESELVPDNRKHAGNFEGEVEVWVDETTYSGASTFAAVVGRSRAGRVIGKTGCPPVYLGNFIIKQLPCSQLSCYIPFTRFYDSI